MLMNFNDYTVEQYGAIGDGKTVCTEEIQEALDAAAAAGGGRVILTSGIYMSGALFVKSNTELIVEQGAVLRAVTDEQAYPSIWTRIAGIEMEWPSALINISGQEGVTIGGQGTLDGQGEYWWQKYWGVDRAGGMFKDYSDKGVRWAAEYDCKRPRLLLVSDSIQVKIRQLMLERSPFSNVHICYSDIVTVSGLRIERNEGPGTDGVVIDSSVNVIVEHCSVECSGDNFSVRAGRDADGLRVNRPCESIVIRHCTMSRGLGIAIGCETSGGIRNVDIFDIKAAGTENGFNLKSARTRGGIIENIRVSWMRMTDVRFPFSFLLNGNPNNRRPQIPDSYPGLVPHHWVKIVEPVEPPWRGIPHARNIFISEITVRSLFEGKSCEGDARSRNSIAFHVEAYMEQPIEGVRFSNIDMTVHNAGTISHAYDWTMENVVIRTIDPAPLHMVDCSKVRLPFHIKLHEEDVHR
jgi:hypothetical protein